MADRLLDGCDDRREEARDSDEHKDDNAPDPWPIVRLPKRQAVRTVSAQMDEWSGGRTAVGSGHTQHSLAQHSIAARATDGNAFNGKQRL